MKIVDALSSVTDLYIETAPFIYYTESRPIYFDKMHVIFEYVLKERIRVFTSAITLSECLTKPLRERDEALVEAYETLFQRTHGINLISIDPRIARRSANLRAEYGLRSPDSLHIATALEDSCDAFLTNDLGLKRVVDIPILILDEMEIG